MYGEIFTPRSISLDGRDMAAAFVECREFSALKPFFGATKIHEVLLFFIPL
jgi:hypothetical protein